MAITMANTEVRRKAGHSGSAPGKALPEASVRRFCTPLAIALFAIGAADALADNVKVVPRLDVSETYSDNITLAPAGQEKSAFVTEVSPGISLSGAGARVKYKLDYNFQAMLRSDDAVGNSFYHQLAADAKAELVKQAFFVDAQANVRQQYISPLGPVGVDTTSDTSNITTVSTAKVSPYLRHRFGSFASGEARYTHDEVRYDTGGSNSSGDSIALSLNSGPAFNELFWGANYSKRKIDYAAAANTEFQSTSGTLGYHLTPKFRVFATGGNESNNYQTAGTSTGGSFWNVGFGWAPSVRTSLEASYGHRFFGTTHSLSFSHRTRRTTWTAAYSQEVTSVRALELVPETFGAYYTDPATGRKYLLVDRTTGQPLLVTLYTPYFTDETIIYKRLNGSVGIHTGKSTVGLTAYHTTQDQQLSGANVNQYGGDASWNWRFGGRTSSTLSTGWSRVEMSTQDQQYVLRYVRAIITRQFQPKVNGSLELRHQERGSNQPDGGYAENAIVVRVSMTF